MAPGFFKPKPYVFDASNDPYLVSLFVGGTTAGLNFNKDDVLNPNYAAYQASPSDMLYRHETAFGTFLDWSQTGSVTQSGYFSLGITIPLFAGNTSNSGDYAELDIEFLTDGGTVRAALRMRRSASFVTQLSYGTSLSSLSNATLSGGGANYVQGDLTFTSDSLIFTRTRADFYNDSFTLSGLTMSDVSKMRFSNGRVRAQSIDVNSVATVTVRAST
jgi:hypothetical protein